MVCNSRPKSNNSKPSTVPSEDGKDAATRNPDVARAVQVAKHLGLSPVGWVVARPGGMAHGAWMYMWEGEGTGRGVCGAHVVYGSTQTTGEGGDGGGFLNAQEVVVAAKLQVR